MWLREFRVDFQRLADQDNAALGSAGQQVDGAEKREGAWAGRLELKDLFIEALGFGEFALLVQGPGPVELRLREQRYRPPHGRRSLARSRQWKGSLRTARRRLF